MSNDTPNVSLQTLTRPLSWPDVAELAFASARRFATNAAKAGAGWLPGRSNGFFLLFRTLLEPE